MQRLLAWSYFPLLILLAIYSHALIDPNLTLLQQSAWVNFRNMMVEFGYYHRDWSWWTYVVLILWLFSAQWALAQEQIMSPKRLALITGGILLFSYPFLSHDLFNYIFDAKIFTFYHENPYLKTALDFQGDQWVRFMHWTHRTYPYGPSFLLITLIPSWLALGKFILNYLFFKILFILGYLLSVSIVSQKNKIVGIWLATQPFILIEAVVNSHNEILAVALAILALHWQQHRVKAHIAAAMSIGIKYMSLPITLLLWLKQKPWLALGLQICILGYVCMKLGIQQWYFLNLFIFVMIYPNFIKSLNIFFLGLLLSYYPYIALGGWDATDDWSTPDKVNLKNIIVISGLIINLFVFVYKKIRAYRKRS